FCPGCRSALIERRGYTIHTMRVSPEGKCPQCGTHIAGVWA
ncbi:MAG: AmmeMemoRadiSam system radical SAM enzyme, partial [Anaerolineales bacterium]|nr:AmmeMemoRadiSam system radical SAM enzyme [Anaerolineales bacterium]